MLLHVFAQFVCTHSRGQTNGYDVMLPNICRVESETQMTNIHLL